MLARKPVINDKYAEYIKAYFNTKDKNCIKPNYIGIIDGLLSRKDVDETLGSNPEDTGIWDRAVGIYMSNTYDTYRLVQSIYDNDVDGFVKSFEDGKDAVEVYVDKVFIEYVVNNYSDPSGREIGYGLLDKYLLNKIATFYDLDLMYSYMQNTLIDLYNNPNSQIIFNGLDPHRGQYQMNINYLGDIGYQNTQRKDNILKIVGFYLQYCFNESIIRQNINFEKVSPGFRFMQVLSNIYLDRTGNNIYNPNVNSLFFDVCGIRDICFIIKIKACLFQIYESMAERNSGIRNELLKVKDEHMKFINRRSLKGVLINQKPANYIQNKKMANDGIDSGNVNERPELFVTVQESLCITKKCFAPRDVTKALSSDNGLSYFAETVGIQITRTDAEKVRNISRRIDVCLIQFENMSNQWNKVDAMNYAHDILNDIDDMQLVTTNKDTMLALEALKSQLLTAMADARKIDIKKLRTNIVINYPAGYGPSAS